jgi:cyclohexanecarboxylate-CoA ligase
LSSPRPAEALAVVDGDVEIDAGQLEALVGGGGRRAAGARRRRGDVVTWQLPNWWEALVLFRACWRCGAVAAPIHHQVGSAEVARVLEDLEPALALSASGAAAGRTGRCHPGDGTATVVSTPCWGQPVRTSRLHGAPTWPSSCSPRARPAQPKAVLHTHRGLAYKALSMTRAHGLTSGDVALMPSPWLMFRGC